MSFIDTRLNEESFMILIESTPSTIESLNFSKNEHLTAKCF